MSEDGLKALVEELYPLHRTLASEGTDRALEMLGDYMPEDCGYSIESYTPGDPVWTWRVPERYVVREAWVETTGGERVIDFADSPLHLVSYSEPIDAELDWDELEPHLHVAERRPAAIPWEFKFYERSWGFCLSKELFDRLDRRGRYRVRVDSEFVTGPGQGLRVGVAVVHPEETPAHDEQGEILVCAHVCHPAQANDDAAGVATAVGVARRLASKPLPPGSMSVRFLFCPETIGSICYLAHHEDLIPRLRGGVFSEMTGNDNSLVLQRTRQDDHRLDRIARNVLAKREPAFREGAFREVIGNDEMVINGPGVDVPCISISRWPYPEYHTSDDNPEIVSDERLNETADVIEEIIRVFASDYTPRRTFRGPVFLSGHGLWVDRRENLHLNQMLEKIMLRLEGDRTVFDIADELDLDYWETRACVERFRTRELVRIETAGIVS